MPVTKQGVPLKQVHQRELPHNAGHILNGPGNFFKRRKNFNGGCPHVRKFFLRWRYFGRGAATPPNGGDGTKRAQEKGGIHPGGQFTHGAHKNHGKYKQANVGKGLPEPGKKALCLKPGGLLVGIKLIGNKSAVGFHSRIVARIKHPKQSGCHPKAAAEGIKEQGNAAKNGPDKKIGLTTAKLWYPGFIAQRANDRLHQQARHGAGEV